MQVGGAAQSGAGVHQQDEILAPNADYDHFNGPARGFFQRSNAKHFA